MFVRELSAEVITSLTPRSRYGKGLLDCCGTNNNSYLGRRHPATRKKNQGCQEDDFAEIKEIELSPQCIKGSTLPCESISPVAQWTEKNSSQ